MTPSWLVMYASYIDSSRSQTASQLTFNAGSIQDAALLKVPLVHAGCLRDFTPLTVEITVVHDVSIGQGSDSDIKYGISDGTRFVGFFTVDKLNFNDPRAPCSGVEGVSGATFTASRYEPPLPKPSDSFYPGQYVITLKLDQRWGRATQRMTQASWGLLAITTDCCSATDSHSRCTKLTKSNELVSST